MLARDGLSAAREGRPKTPEAVRHLRRHFRAHRLRHERRNCCHDKPKDVAPDGLFFKEPVICCAANRVVSTGSYISSLSGRALHHLLTSEPLRAAQQRLALAFVHQHRDDVPSRQQPQTKEAACKLLLSLPVAECVTERIARYVQASGMQQLDRNIRSMSDCDDPVDEPHDEENSLIRSPRAKTAGSPRAKAAVSPRAKTPGVAPPAQSSRTGWT
jgi:hypothetical protein